MLIATLQPTPLDQWRHCLGGRRRRAQPRPIGAMGYLIKGPADDDLIEVERLTFILLYDQQIGSGPCALRLAGYSSNRVPWGVRFGGRANCRFLKDLALQPVLGGQGYRLDLANDKLLILALGLNRKLDRHTRLCQDDWVRPYLPKLWAGFYPEEAAGITGDGPELAAYAARIGRTPASLLEYLRRNHQGLILFPLAWVSHHWQQAASIFADLRHFPERQVFRIRHHNDLTGFHDATEYDFRSRAGRCGLRCPRYQRQPVLASA